ncbi:MAG: T9SS type B sorting domain-containing protein, partial [Flavobacterium sp.]
TLTVVAAPQITTQPQSSTVCLNGTPTTLSVAYSNGTGTATYQWYDASGPIAGATSATFIPTAAIVGTNNYYCIITFSAGGCSSITSNTATVTVNPAAVINSQPLATQTICVGGSSNALTVSYSGGVGTASYQWYSNTSNSTTGGTPVGGDSSSYTPPVFNTPGSYYYYAVISLNGNGCGSTTSAAAEVVVVPDPVVSAQPLATQTQCQNSTATTLTVAATGGTGTLNYQWYSVPTNTNTGGTAIVGANSAGYTPPTPTVGTFYYYCQITQSASGCSVNSAVATLTVVPAPQIITQPQSSTVCLNGTPTTLSVAYSNGTGTATYQWYDVSGPIAGATSATFTPTAAIVGSNDYYCIVAFSEGGCSGITSNTATVVVNPLPIVDLQPLPTQSICVGGSVLPLSVGYSGGVGTASYQWYSNTSNSTTGGTPVGGDSSSYTPPVFNTPGSYYYYAVISLNGNGCGSTTSAAAEVVVVPDPVVNAQPLATQTVCQNAISADLTLSASGGVGSSYNYQWYSSPTNDTSSGTPIAGENNAIFTPPTATAGTVYYYCEVSQAPDVACSVLSAIAQVNVNLAPAIDNQPVSSTVCVNQAATLLSVTYLNGAGTPDYQWFQNSVASNLGGTAIPGATASTYTASTNISGVSYYYCHISFASLSGGCEVITSEVATVTVNDNPVISDVALTICSATAFNVSPDSTGGNIVPSGTTYTWPDPVVSPAGSVTGSFPESVPQTGISQTLINTTTSPATVTYLITPLSGVCHGQNFTIVVTVNPAINPNVVLTNNTCYGVNTASITTDVTGGIPNPSGNPYDFSWTGPNGFSSNASTILNLEPGSYDLTISDSGGCPFTHTYIITEPTDIALSADNETDISCYGSNDGSISIAVSGGTGSYSYTWTQNGVFYSSAEDISGLAPGTYVVSVTDANSCGPKSATFTITEPTLLVATLVSQTNVLCYGDSTGAISVNVSGGTPGAGYAFSWTGPGGFSATSQDLTAIPAGDYLLTVTDSNGCTKELSVTITQSSPIVIDYTTTPITCYGANNASISVTLSGGNAPYQYQWSNLATALSQTDLAAGDYIITVTDNVGCIKIQTINIPEAPVFMVNPIVANISCYGAHDGSINLNLTGGIAPVALSWSDGSTSGLVRNNLGPGTYTATISDGTPCYIVRSFTIVEPSPIVLSANVTDALGCTNANSGAINLTVAGGTPPYTYSWSNNATTEDLAGITSGNYLVNVTDANGCTKSAQFAIVRPDPIAIAVDTQTDFDCTTHTVSQNFIASVSGGVPPYHLQWSSGTVSGNNNQIMHSDVNGTVLLTVTDNIGCVANYTVTVDNPVLGYTDFEPTSFGYTSYGIYSIGDPIQFNSTITGDYVSVIWDFGDGTFSNEVNPTHIYVNPRDYVVTQTVTYPFGCVYVQTISLIIEQGYLMIVPNAFTPNNDSLNDHFHPFTKRLKNVQLDVYDTWGSLIYSEKGDVLVGWDGKIKGSEAENGNYYCKVSGETFYGTTVKENHPFVLIK